MKAVMRKVLTEDELKKWEAARDTRMLEYDQKRQ
jgi:hypothetical protein